MSDAIDPNTSVSAAAPAPARRAYEAPRLTSQASLEQVTLFSGTVTDAGVIFGD